METLVQRLVQNPHDQDTITYAHQAGQSDPKSYAMLLEKVGTATSDPAAACHWLTEAANVWSTTLGDAHRAARALMIAIDRDPTQATPADRLAELYREKGDTKALVALLERRSKALTLLALQDPSLRSQLAILHEELGQLWQNPPLDQPKKAIENYKRAIDFDPGSQFSIYAIRELYKGAGQWQEALPFFALEQALVADPERQIALFQDEGDVRKNALDFAGSTLAYRRARELEGGQDPTLKQQLASVLLERVQAAQNVPTHERQEGAALFVELAEE
jgi:cellulose synthase operon protein C